MTFGLMERSKTEMNLCRLLSKCELRGREDPTKPDWRLEKYIEALNAFLLLLMKNEHRPSKETLNEYSRRIEFLKKLVESNKVKGSLERVVAGQLMPHGVTTSSDNLTREIHQKASAKYAADVRQDLFRSDKGDSGDLRRRKDEKSSGEDLDALLKHHHSFQEKVTEDMISIARSLKQQSQLANEIINKDIETMSKSATQMDKNDDRLMQEAAILAEHNRKATKHWLWILIIVVFIVFINMVLFMKVMKK